MSLFATATQGTVSIIVMNSKNFALTEYSNFNFNSFAKLNGKHIASNGSGIYELEGSDDAGTDISASVKPRVSDFGTSLLKRLSGAYFSIKNIGTMTAKAVDENGDEGGTRAFTSSTDKYKTRRVKFAKGERSRFWTTEINNVSGSDFEISTIELQMEETTRRIR